VSAIFGIQETTFFSLQKFFFQGEAPNIRPRYSVSRLELAEYVGLKIVYKTRKVYKILIGSL
jgi:hypothetical protein